MGDAATRFPSFSEHHHPLVSKMTLSTANANMVDKYDGHVAVATQFPGDMVGESVLLLVEHLKHLTQVIIIFL